MYSALDQFLGLDTWHTRHAYDTERFMKALHSMIRDPKFNPDAMGEYMKDKLGVSDDDADPYFSKTVDKYVSDAWAVSEYLSANHL